MKSSWGGRKWHSRVDWSENVIGEGSFTLKVVRGLYDVLGQKGRFQRKSTVACTSKCLGCATICFSTSTKCLNVQVYEYTRSKIKYDVTHVAEDSQWLFEVGDLTRPRS